MTGTAGPRHGLVWGYVPGESGWGVSGFNPNFAKLDALVHLTVIAITATPPATPGNGDCYIVAASPTGAWAGHTDDIAVYYTAGGWLFIDPAVGVRAFDRASDGYVRFDGVDWIEEVLPDADLSGPASAVNNNIAVFDGTTGKIVKDSGKGLPATPLVGLGDPQELINKVIRGEDNTLSVRLDADVVGNLSVAHLNGGVGASNTTVWHGDGAWRVPAGGGGGGASVTVSETPPADPVAGQLWFDAASACMFVWYEDSTAGAWVVAVNVGSGGGGAGVLSISTTGPLSVSAPVGDVVLSLDAPLAIAFGGSGAASGPAALAALGAAPILSPVLLGTPTGPTASPEPRNGQLATTAFVGNALSTVGAISISAGVGITVTPSPLTGVGSVALSVPVAISSGGTGGITAPAALAALGAAPIDSPVLTGDPRSVTPATSDNDTSIATTAYVKAQGYVIGGPYLPLAGGTMTGTLTAPEVDITAPGYTSVDISGDSGSTILSLGHQAGNAYIAATGATNLSFQTNGANRLSIAASGNTTITGSLAAAGGALSGPLVVGFVDSGLYQFLAAGTTYGVRVLTTGATAQIDGVTASVGALAPLVVGGSKVSLATGGVERVSIDGGNTTIAGDTTINAVTQGALTLISPAATKVNIVMVLPSVHTYTLAVDTSGFWGIYDNTGGAWRMQLNGTACINTTGSWTALSDVVLKQNVEPYERGLEAILALNPVMFQYSAGTPFASEDEPSDPLVGLLAHEVEPHIPEVCGTMTVTIREEERQVQTLNPGDLTYVLINAVKELEARVRELEARPPNPPEAQPA